MVENKGNEESEKDDGKEDKANHQQLTRISDLPDKLIELEALLKYGRSGAKKRVNDKFFTDRIGFIKPAACEKTS